MDSNIDLSNLSNQYTTITRNLREFIGDETELKTILKERSLKVYFGTAPTGRVHIGYLVPLLKVVDLLEAGCSVKILLADLHAFLDARKSSLNDLSNRTEYYEHIIRAVLELLGVTHKQLESSVVFIRGTSFQLSEKYTLDVYKALSLVSLNEARHAGADVVRQSDNPMMNSLIYPTLQALDEEYLQVDAELSGIDQRKIAVHSRSIMPQLGYKKRMYFMTPMVPALSSVKSDTKMSASDTTSKIDLLDEEKIIQKKIKSVYCLEGDIKDNTLLTMTHMILFPTLARLNKKFLIKRPEKYGGDVEYTNYADLELDFENKKLHPGDLKKAVADILAELLKPIRVKFSEQKFKDLLNKCYN